MKLITDIVLFLISYLLSTVFLPLGFFYSVFKRIPRYYFNIAISIDQLGNTVMQGLFNDILVKKDRFRFGNPDETISSVLGKNKAIDNLTLLGKAIAWLLNKIQYHHVEKAIEQTKK